MKIARQPIPGSKGQRETRVGIFDVWYRPQYESQIEDIRKSLTRASSLFQKMGAKFSRRLPIVVAAGGWGTRRSQYVPQGPGVGFVHMVPGGIESAPDFHTFIHELAHAYHYLVLGVQNNAIQAQYGRARLSDTEDTGGDPVQVAQDHLKAHERAATSLVRGAIRKGQELEVPIRPYRGGEVVRKVRVRDIKGRGTNTKIVMEFLDLTEDERRVGILGDTLTPYSLFPKLPHVADVWAEWVKEREALNKAYNEAVMGRTETSRYENPRTTWFPTDYAKTNYSEFFAELVTARALAPGKLDPEVKAWVDSVLKTGKAPKTAASLSPGIRDKREYRAAIHKEPWQMTLDEYWASGLHRTTDMAVQSFEGWLRDKRINLRDVASETEEADFIGGVLFRRPNQTSRERGLLKSLAKKVERRKQLLAEYQAEVEHRLEVTPLNRARKSDVAYARSRHKREIRKALRQGKPVPVEVLVEYPELHKQAGCDTRCGIPAPLLPLMDPMFNVREITKQLILLEDHLAHPRKRCSDCIRKHLLSAEALAEEAVTLDTDRTCASILDGLVDRIQAVWNDAQENPDYDALGVTVRELRKGLSAHVSMVRVARRAALRPSASTVASRYAADKVKVRKKDTGRVVWVSPDTMKNSPGDYEEVKEDEEDTGAETQGDGPITDKGMLERGKTITEGIERPQGWRPDDGYEDLTDGNMDEWAKETTVQTPGGSLWMGCVHPDVNDEESIGTRHFMTKAVPSILEATQKALDEGKRVVHLAEGDDFDYTVDDGKGGEVSALDSEEVWNEQHAMAKALHNNFGDKVEHATWDDDAVDVMNPKSPVWERLTHAAGGDGDKARAGVAVMLMGQGDDPKDLAEKGILTKEVQSLVSDLGFDVSKGVSEPDREKMNRIAFPRDSGDPPNEISAIGDVYNAARQENFLKKVKEIEADGGVVVGVAGATHNWNLKPVLEGVASKKVLAGGPRFTGRIPQGQDPWKLAQKAGINILSHKDWKAGYEDKGLLVAALFDYADAECYDFDIVVDPAYQKRGLGAKLMDLAISEYKELTDPFPDIQFCLDSVNPVTVRMLKQRGFVETGRERGHTLMTRRAMSLLGLVKDFLREVRPHLNPLSCDTTKGKCDGVATDLHYYLADHGVASQPLEGRGLIPPMGPKAHPDWIDFVGDDPKNQQYLAHVVVRVGNQVVDLTGAQFGMGSGIVIEPLSAFRQRWQHIKEFTPWKRVSASKVAAHYLFAGTGDCYEANGQYFMAHALFPGDDKNLRLVHGEVCGQGPMLGTNFGHAWVEDGNTVIDVSNNRDIRMPKALYYMKGCIGLIENMHVYKPEEFRRKVLESGHWGPWDLHTSTGL